MTLSPRINKIIRDVWQNRARTVLTLLAMVIGLTGVGAVLCAYAILLREMDANYMRTNPASAALYLDRVDERALTIARELPGVAEVEERGFYAGRIQAGTDDWRTLWLFVVPDFDQMRLSTFAPEQGAWPPATGEMLLERVAFRVLDGQLDETRAAAKIGDTRTVVIPGYPAADLRISGSVHAPGEAPAWMENLVYGYVTPATLERLGVTGLNEITIKVAENYFDHAHAKQVAQQVKAALEQNGYAVSRFDVPFPGKHPHASQMKALLFLLTSFGGLALILSSIIVINLFSAMLVQQIRQIGVMKTLGASTSQIMGLYLGQVLLLALIAMCLALPTGLLLARGYAALAAKMLNFVIADASVPVSAYLGIIAIGLAVPLVSAFSPVWRGSRLTVKAALTDYGIGQGQFELNRFLLWLSELRSFPRPLLLSLRNTFRRHGRVALTIGTLAIGGAVFMSALNIGASIKRTVAVIGEHLRYDVEISLAQPIPADSAQQIALTAPGVQAMEGWGEARGVVVHADGSTGEFLPIIAPQADSAMFVPRIIDGRWLRASEPNSVVITHILRLYEPDLRIGVTLTLRLGQQDVALKIVGVVQQLGPPLVFINDTELAALTNQAGLVKNLRITGQDRSVAAQAGLMQALERSFAAAGIPIAAMSSVQQYRKVLEDHFLIIVSFLVMMSGLIVMVGGLGLMTTMSIQIIERTREIGVMRAVGASSHALIGMIQHEGGVIALISWCLASALSFPISYYVGNMFGNIFFDAPLDFAIAPISLAIWFGLSFLFAFAAYLFPALKAIRLTVRDTLAYE